MNTFIKLITTILISLSFSSFADVSDSEELQYDSENQASIISPTDPQLKWQKYLSENGIQEGANDRPDGRVFFISYASNKVSKPLDDKGFMDSWNRSYIAAVLEAKSINKSIVF